MLKGFTCFLKIYQITKAKIAPTKQTSSVKVTSNLEESVSTFLRSREMCSKIHRKVTIVMIPY